MIVILNKNVKGTGKAGDVVKVSDGFARNMLLPRGLATEATEGNIKNLEKQKKIAADKKAAERAEAEKIAQEFEKYKVEVKTKGGEGGKLFGSVTSMDIAQALKEQYGVDVDKKKIILDAPIKQTGEYTLNVKLYPEVVGKLNVKILV